MNFCVQCGTALPNLSRSPGDATTESYGNVLRQNNEVKNFPSNLAAPPTPSKSGKKTLWILGGIFSLIVLLFVGSIGLIGFNAWMANKKKPSPSPSPTSVRIVNKPIVVNKPIAPTPPPSLSPSPVDSPAPTVSFTPPSVPTKKGNFTVAANLGWQLSNIDVVPDESFTTTAKGAIDLDGLKKGVSSSGITDENAKSRRIYQEYPTGALLMRTRYADGKVSIIQPVTAPPSLGLWKNAPDERGKIEFCINDNKPERNTGQIIVSVVMISAPDAKK